MQPLEVVLSRESPEAMAALRRVMAAQFTCGNPVRDEAYRLALSAAIWRLIHFGVEDGFANYRAQDLANFTLIAEGTVTELLIRTAFTRAAVENDQALLKHLIELGLVREVQIWLASITHCPLQDLPGLLAPLSGEERHVARLLAGRRDPGLIDAAWLWDIPVAPGDPLALPTVAYHLAALQVVTREDLLSSTATYLARHRSVLLCREPDDLLVPLVLRSSEHPQTLLAPFEGMYGDPTITAAAAWHLEHRQPREAWALAHDMRPLSLQADDAWTIAGLAAVELGRFSDAETLRQRIQTPAGRDRLLLAIAEAQPEAVPVERLAEAGRSCGPDNPELFFRILKEILRRGSLPLGRNLAEARRTAINDEEPLRSILTEILSR